MVTGKMKHPSKRWRDVTPKDEVHGCTDKRVYITRSEAKRAARRYAQNYGGKHTVYHCDNCNGFHLTTHGRIRRKSNGSD